MAGREGRPGGAARSLLVRQLTGSGEVREAARALGARCAGKKRVEEGAPVALLAAGGGSRWSSSEVRRSGLVVLGSMEVNREGRWRLPFGWMGKNEVDLARIPRGFGVAARLGMDGTRGLDFRDWSRVGLFI